MLASSPTTIDGKTFDRYSLNLIVSGSYLPDGKVDASVICNLTPTRVENGVVETAPADQRSIRLGSLAQADAETLAVVGAIQTALQQFLTAKGY